MAHFTPPYARIAAELRRRIADGELAPGDRVPSTRQIAREWNVALATATKVLATLRQDGLVEARPRVGTVVAPRRQRPTPVGTRTGTPAAIETQTATGTGAERELTRERIVRVAIGIADAEGLAALSMRGVAARLGAATMAAYRYVNSKDELVLLMADTVLGELQLPPDTPAHPPATPDAPYTPDTPAKAPADWRTRLELGARSLWQLHRAHPWLAQIGPLTRPLLLPNLLAYSEWMLSALDGHGLPPATVLNLNVLLYSHIQGLAIQWERETAAESSTGLTEDAWMAQQEETLASLTASGAYPTFTRLVGSLGTDGYDLHLDELFEIGLASVLDSLERRIGRRP
ncbi:TetR/AcrR family transcriptional regulator C-terminal domain-containing protein [Streptomyces sp. 891-h]|uniref:TetR/AcrR family transcriptional regulator C-terminal domain-containing protein n=1 Tax=Streptomyces sp. 891-h TaxID=2720714 RepID=UPI001FAA2988|nr:TetR/AcrR family transcriptional regulator C-terminal domain-containing protein [Streptomyces sp. 891-h]UNZ18673.1 GntR family transcriptional regulator [Streptomyces sp. 891-h]